MNHFTDTCICPLIFSIHTSKKQVVFKNIKPYTLLSKACISIDTFCLFLKHVTAGRHVLAFRFEWY